MCGLQRIPAFANAEKAASELTKGAPNGGWIRDYDIVAYLSLDGQYELRQYVGGEPVLLIERVYDPVGAAVEALDLAYEDGSDAWIQEAHETFRCPYSCCLSVV